MHTQHVMSMVGVLCGVSLIDGLLCGHWDGVWQPSGAWWLLLGVCGPHLAHQTTSRSPGWCVREFRPPLTDLFHLPETQFGTLF